MYNNDKAAKCEVNDTTDGSCLVSGTNFRRLRLAMSGKYDDMFYYKASVTGEHLRSRDLMQLIMHL